MSQATSYTSDEVPLSFHMPVRFATPVILPLPQSPSTFKHERLRASPARNIEPIVAGSSRLPTSDQTLSTAPASASHQHTIAEDHSYMTGRELRRGAYPYSTPTDDIQPAPEPQTKKSHSRKQPEGHIPRPRNAFILFRCDFVAQKKIPASVEPDHRNISRIVGRIWKAMSDEDRRPWVEEAKKEREKHKRLYPEYRYSPTSASAAAATTALKEKRAQNQKIRESMGVLPAWGLTSDTRNALQSWTHLAEELRPHATHRARMQSPTRTTDPDTHWSGPTTQVSGGNVASHAPSGELSSPPTVSWEPPSQSQQNWSFATSSTDPPSQHCPLQNLGTSSPSQVIVPPLDCNRDVPAASSSHFDSPDPSPVRETQFLPPFMFVANHHATNNPEFSGFHFSPAPKDLSVLAPPFADSGACGGNDSAPQYQPQPQGFEINPENLFEGPPWTTDQIDEFIRNMQTESSFNHSQ